MTVIDKLSDRNGLIFNAISLIIDNEENKTLNIPRLQWRLFQYGIYIDFERLKQAVSVMIEKKIIKTALKDDKVADHAIPKTPAETGV